MLDSYRNVIVVSIAEAGSSHRSFSNDTGVAEVLVIGAKGNPDQRGSEVTFAILNDQPSNPIKSALLAEHIQAFAEAAESETSRSLVIGDTHEGELVRTVLTGDRNWPISGILDLELATVAASLESGSLTQVGQPASVEVPIPMTAIGDLGVRGPVDRDIKEDVRGGTLRGPFTIHQPPKSSYPTYPVIWDHKAPKERRFHIEPDAEGEIRTVAPADQGKVNENASRMSATASRVHFNRNFRFNSQSTAVAITERPCIGGQAWPSISLHDEGHEAAFTLWSNSTLGLMLYWWCANKRQGGRGNISITRIPEVSALDTRALTDEQQAEAKRQIDLLRDERFLPFDQIDEDPARARLARAILVDVLGLPESLVESGGPIDLIRRKLAREPQIHDGKKSRVVFTDDGETSVRRHDRD
ncbi:MAG: hypothetical protein F4Z51_07000 [Chloroflexi bacterium]|nr:hypothetical protein [Chloroflexota bacterium]